MKERLQCVTTVWVRTHVARTCFCCTVCARTYSSSCVCTYTHGTECLQKGSLHMCRFSPSRFLPSHVSPIFAVPWRSLGDHSRPRLNWRSRPHFLFVLTCHTSAGGRAPLRTCTSKFCYFAKSDANTGYEPKKFDKNTSVDHDMMLIVDPNHNFSDFLKKISPTFSKTTNENTSQLGVHTDWICFGFFSLVTWFFRWKEKKAIGKPLLETEKIENVLLSVLQSQCQRKINGMVLLWVWRVTESLTRNSLSESSILMEENFREHIERRAHQIFLVKIQFRESYIRLSPTWRSQSWSEETLKMHQLRRNLSLNLKDNFCWKPIRACSTRKMFV